MPKHRFYAIAASIAILAMLTAVLIASNLALIPQERSIARDQAGGVDPYILSGASKLTANSYAKTASTTDKLNFSITLASSAVYTLADLNITWTIDTEWNSTVYASGPNLAYVYYSAGTYWINVTVSPFSNASDVEMKYIHVEIKTDFDGDGIPDWWERQWFGDLTTADDNKTDYDHDGVPDGAEYWTGGNPKDPNDNPTFIDQFGLPLMAIMLVIVAILIFMFVVMPKMKSKREADEKKKIAAAVEVEKSLLGFEELETKPKK